VISASIGKTQRFFFAAFHLFELLLFSANMRRELEMVREMKMVREMEMVRGDGDRDMEGDGGS
jgi:hypothetical protein